MVFFDREILDGLEKIPTPNSPGTLIITAHAQSIFSAKDPGNSILAGSDFGNGKILVAAHDVYLNWLHEKNDEVIKKFMNRLKLWLTGTEQVEDSEVINLDEAISNIENLNNYKIIKWHHNHEIDDQIEKKILRYVVNGGSLFCGSTPWGYLQIYPNKKISDMCLYQFLKNYTGIFFTAECLSLSNESEVCDNKSKYSQFNMALERTCSNPQKIIKYSNTLQSGFDVLYREGILSKNKILELLEMLLNQSKSCGWNIIPNFKQPVCDIEQINVIKLIGKSYNYVECMKAPGIDQFPGDFKQEPELENIQLEISAKFQERLSTGYYLPAGSILIINICSGDYEGWSVRIGAHTDDLSNCCSLPRWPSVTLEKKLTSQLMSISSAFGGLIYFESPNAGTLIVNLRNVVESPYIDLTKPETIDDWSRRRNAPGLWADLAGNNIIFTTPSECIRHIENPIKILEFWDKVVETHHWCRGSDHKKYRRERVVNDIKPSAGYMHSGYPIVTHLDCCQKECSECIFDLDKLSSNGNWGLFHELGHNMQRGEWTFEGCGEVTVNIFSMHATEFVVGKKLIDQLWPRDRISEFPKFFSKDPSYQNWKENVGMALMTFAQLIKHFGWESMRQFMKEYEKDINERNENLPRSNQDKIDQWVIRYSKIVSRNIKPQFEMFGLPVSDYVNEHISKYETWCPEMEKNPELFFSEL